ncbi:hypothetical protein FJ364_03145 [Candidatus Dependentiae bacterium]|nr:hypothetical protein [Candidatus Dependentiae bacterium]
MYRKAQDTFGDSYGIASKVQIMNARVPTYPVPANGSPFVGGMNAARGNQLYQQALGTTGGGAAVPASALQAAISGVPNNNNAVAPLTAATTGLGTDAGGAENATRLVNNSDGANGHPGVGDQPNMLAAYQAASQLYATTNLDVLGAAAAVAVAVGGGHRGRADAAVPVATQARNLIQNLQRADVSYTESNRQESMITHVFGASLGYTIEPRAGYPVMLGIGGQYDLPHSTNAGLESFKLFCKLGISF